jgi:hypothetical protein
VAVCGDPVALNAFCAAGAAHNSHGRLDKGARKDETFHNLVTEQLDYENRSCSGFNSVSHAMEGVEFGAALRWD